MKKKSESGLAKTHFLSKSKFSVKIVSKSKFSVKIVSWDPIRIPSLGGAKSFPVVFTY